MRTRSRRCGPKMRPSHGTWPSGTKTSIASTGWSRNSTTLRRRPREAPEAHRWPLPPCRDAQRGGTPRSRGHRGQPRSERELCHRHRRNRDRPRRLPGYVISIGLRRIRTKGLSPTDDVACSMGSSGGSAPLRAEEVVRRFYDFLARGRLVDALNLFTTDARLRDASGRESAGIRAITSSLLTYRVPQDIAVDQMEPEDGEIRATVRSPSGRSVGRFSVARGRIKSLRMERA